MAMKVSLFSTGFSNWPIERTFAAAAANGYDGVDIGGFRPHGYAPDILGDVADIRTRILACVEKYQMPIVSYVPENTGSPHSFVFQDKALSRSSTSSPPSMPPRPSVRPCSCSLSTCLASAGTSRR